MTPRRRELMLKVIDGDERLLRVMHFFTQFYRCNEMVEWLLKNKLTGQRLWELNEKQFEGSTFELSKFVLTKVKRERKTQPVFAGLDFIARAI